MTQAIGSAHDPALQPAAAAARPVDAGVEATRKALDQDELEGRAAVRLTEDATQAGDRPLEPQHKGRLVDRTV